MLAKLSQDVRQYLLVTANYWCFTLTDGALRMLIVLHFHNLGFNALTIAGLFVFYELFGMVTNLFGGYLGARIGLNRTMNMGLLLQIVALLSLMAPTELLSVTWVMAAGASSGIAKDLNKMSAKSSIKALVSDDNSNGQGGLYKWIAWLTGSKNALKGVGFFMGGALLTLVGFSYAMGIMAAMLSLMLLLSLFKLKGDLGKAKTKPKFTELFSKSRNINYLAGARVFLFGARDIWFVVALPLYLASVLDWASHQVSMFLALWVIGYGIVQASAPKITKGHDSEQALLKWGLLLGLTPLVMVAALYADLPAAWVLMIGLGIFGAIFALNSSLHSYLIVSYACNDGVSKDVGFYYMANAFGRLIGTLLSGWVYMEYGIEVTLLVSAAMLLLANGISRKQMAKP
ncbi:organoarsenical effux MFS transporter ArsJ [Paraferrimonas sp. SM1919]|uniref:organoarsenical effux MFS transporter ArsJ n=1 Tax=Paraferrimonas sp. SM1919 TaxID=2662263 RepID=UPI0013D6DEEC|nr:organoarsenical effux MFS transporter ArsJ [Paraferrimonas sp. SM1919]